MSDELKKIAEDMNNSDIKELKSTIDDLDKMLSEPVETNRAKLPESIFKNMFVEDLIKNKGQGVIGAKFIEYAGGPYNEVDIIDNKGDTIFTCPPIYDRSSTDKKTKQIPFSEIAGTYELKKSRMPSEANKYMNDISSSIKNSVKVEENGNAYRWSVILNKYNDDAESKEDTITESININTNKVDDDLIDYD